MVNYANIFSKKYCVFITKSLRVSDLSENIQEYFKLPWMKSPFSLTYKDEAPSVYTPARYEENEPILKTVSNAGRSIKNFLSKMVSKRSRYDLDNDFF